MPDELMAACDCMPVSNFSGLFQATEASTPSFVASGVVCACNSMPVKPASKRLVIPIVNVNLNNRFCFIVFLLFICGVCILSVSTSLIEMNLGGDKIQIFSYSFLEGCDPF